LAECRRVGAELGIVRGPVMCRRAFSEPSPDVRTEGAASCSGERDRVQAEGGSEQAGSVCVDRFLKCVLQQGRIASVRITRDWFRAALSCGVLGHRVFLSSLTGSERVRSTGNGSGNDTGITTGSLRW
jgi:hypothetical protein